MASASSLLGLVSQLQSLESSFAAILMEAAMKLANLTDANIFFLVETPQGRKFSGKRHLCDLYVGGQLAPLGDDVEFEVDPSVSAIHERHLSASGEHDDLLFEAENFDAEDALLDSDFSTAAAASSQLLDDDFHSDFGGAFGSGIKQKNFYSSPFVRAAPNRRPANNAASISRKSKKPPTRNGPISPAKRLKPSNCKMEPVYEDSSQNGALNGGVGDAASSRASNLPYSATNGASASLTGDIFEAGGQYDVASVAHSRLPENKVTALSGIVDPSVYVKGSVENRLAVSVCYDLGKILAEMRSPEFSEEEAKAFLKANFDRWILQFNNLRAFLDVMIPNGNPEKGVQFSFMGMLRKAARSGYGCSKKNWNRSKSSMIEYPPAGAENIITQE